MNRRRLLPAAIALVVLAAVSGVLWWLNRSTIPTQPPSTEPAVGTCWNVDADTASGVAPWHGAPVDCNGPHTIEVFYAGQVDRAIVKKERSASGQDKQALDVIMVGAARAGCTATAKQFLGDSARGERVAVLPDFVKPATDGFYVCAMAEAVGPNNDVFLTRAGSMKGAATQLNIECVAADTGGGSLVYVPCSRPHSSEYAGTYTVTPQPAPFNAGPLQTAVTNGCHQIVVAFMGLSSGATRSDVTSAYVGPTTTNSWIGSDQSFACYAHTAASILGSLQGLGTRPLP
jgi:Septum formation